MLKFRRDLNGYGGVINEGHNDQYEFEIAFSSTQPYQRQFWDEQNQEMVVLDEILGNDSNLLIVFYVQIMPDDFVMQLHRF